MYAFGFDSLILNIFSYPRKGCKKNNVFLNTYVFYELIQFFFLKNKLKFVLFLTKKAAV